MSDITKEWQDIIPAFPDWGDSRRKVQLRIDDEQITEGMLRIADVMFDGEDEYPIWEVELADGSTCSLFDFKQIRIKQE